MSTSGGSLVSLAGPERFIRIREDIQYPVQRPVHQIRDRHVRYIHFLEYYKWTLFADNAGFGREIRLMPRGPLLGLDKAPIHHVGFPLYNATTKTILAPKTLAC